jgi:hypothetical protein
MGKIADQPSLENQIIGRFWSLWKRNAWGNASTNHLGLVALVILGKADS